ncbi:hypothetical protein [Patulibacter minatonensis]|uniref:hypothetical protein n=1 Tax=Patulibacter minatonensis TaxID=298163 RepID=UPI0012FCB5CB|nr:hypothetical protein [Patulibacter minatonensis]
MKAKKAKKKTPLAPWLKLPARPEATIEQTVRLYTKDQVADITGRVRDLRRDLGLDDAGTITIDVLDPVGDLAEFELIDQNEDELLDGIDIRWGSVWWRIVRLERSDDGWSVIAEDRAAAYLRQHKRPMKASRNKQTRAAFIYQLVLSVKAGGGIPVYIPELKDKQKIAKAEEPESITTAKRKAKAVESSSGGSGWGSAGSKVKVKRASANSTQLRCLDLALTEAAAVGASRRVMIAMVMCVTQETVAGLPQYTRSNALAAGVTHRGPFQQSPSYGSDADVLDTRKAARAFLLGVHGIPGWKQKHGSLHSAAGNLGQMIDQVQVAGTPSAFGQWEGEATKTVDLWLGRNPNATSTTDAASTKVETYTQQFAFKTSDNDENVNWWDATGQLADDVKWHRWAAGNTFGYASDDELIRGNPVLHLSRDMEEVKAMPWTWDVRREAAEITVTLALADEWQLLPGMTVMVDDESPVDGRWIVEKISDSPLTGGGIAEVTLRRRNAKSLEPASVIVQREVKDKASKKATIGGAASYTGKRGKLTSISGTPKSIIDTIVLPVARKHGINVSAASVTAANGRHGPTVNGTRSMHQGPPSVAWAADMSNGEHPTPQMDALANELADMFGLKRLDMTSTGGSKQISNGTLSGYRLQLIYRSTTGGNHYNHVHFGLAKG